MVNKVEIWSKTMGGAVARPLEPGRTSVLDTRPSAPKEASIPPAFICAITQELMSDPVSVSSGHSYERTAIEAWFMSGKNTDPSTGLPLSHLEVVPNIRLRMAIQDWQEAQASEQNLVAKAVNANRGVWMVAPNSPVQAVRSAPDSAAAKVGTRRAGDFIHAEGLLAFDGGWLKFTDAQQFIRVSDGTKTFLVKLPDLNEANRGVWIVLSHSGQHVRGRPYRSSTKLGTRMKGELVFAEGSLDLDCPWLKLVGDQYLQISDGQKAQYLAKLPPLNTQDAGKWITHAQPSPSMLSLHSDHKVRSGPNTGCPEVGRRGGGEIVHVEGSLDVDGLWVKLAAATDQYMLARPPEGGRALISRLPDLDAADAGLWVVTQPGGRPVWGGPSCASARRGEWRRRGELVRAEGSLGLDSDGLWVKLAGAAEEYMQVSEAGGAAAGMVRAPPLEAADGGEWIVTAAAAGAAGCAVRAGVGEDCARVGARRRGEVVAVEGSLMVDGRRWAKLAGGAQQYMLMADSDKTLLTRYVLI